MRIRLALALALCLLPLALTAQASAPAAPASVAKGSLEELTRFMMGSFSSGEQSKQDPKNYFDIRLEVARVWPERTDGVWLYVEQAAADSQAKPYRQRVYHLSVLPQGGFQSLIYSFKGDPLAHAGAWKAAKPLAGLTFEALETRKGCAVFMNFKAGGYTGSTHAQDCESKLRGASYATTEVEISADEMVSWDRGYDAMGKQVWGATQGGYRFKKLAPR